MPWCHVVLSLYIKYLKIILEVKQFINDPCCLACKLNNKKTLLDVSLKEVIANDLLLAWSWKSNYSHVYINVCIHMYNEYYAHVCCAYLFTPEVESLSNPDALMGEERGPRSHTSQYGRIFLCFLTFSDSPLYWQGGLLLCHKYPFDFRY